MAWGGNHGGKGAREVAAAFYAGRRLTRGNCRTDGRTYWLFDNPIARRVPPEDVAATVADKLVNDDASRLLEFSWAGYMTQTTEAHLKTLGVPGVWRGTANKREPRRPELCGNPVDPNRWYTLEESAARPPYEKPARPARFANLTRPLFA